MNNMKNIYSYGYIRPPRQILALQEYYQRLAVDNVSTSQLLTHLNGRPIPPLEMVAKRQYGLTQMVVPDPVPGEPDRKVERWVKVKDFNPGSTNQLQEYIKWKKKELERQGEKELAKLYEVPKNLKTGKPTTSSAELKQLVDKTGDEVLSRTIEYRSISTNRNNFFPNWEPHADGCVHATIGFLPPSGQLNTIKPNVQNLSKHTRTGQIFRSMVEAPPGYTFVSFDKSRFHVVMMGREARSKNYIRFGQLDCHSIFTSWICGEKSLEVDLSNDSDATVKAKVKEIKARFGFIRDKVSKPSVLGNQLGLGARKLFWMNRKYINGEKEARKLQAELAARFDEVEREKKEVARFGYEHNHIRSEFGAVRYLYDVLRWAKNPISSQFELKHGEDYEKALAFKIQHHSFGMMKEEWYKLNELGLLDRFNFINTIHDSNEFMPRIVDLEECIRRVWTVMVSPCKILANEATGPEGLVVGTGVSVGRNMQYYHDLKGCKSRESGGCWMCEYGIDNPEGIREIGVGWKGGVVGGEIEIKW